ncbi:MAG: hypothetical protein CSA86_03275 [Arcobacter sp.]|nr:MAG: hypothetical protein CSA86_03275 [Arcobacter sp.]
MARWRDIKKKSTKQKKENKKEIQTIVPNQSASPLFRIKAFITDMFMIMMPIMYITTYIVLDGKDSFQGSELARWLTMALYGLIVIIFWVKKGQTPGFKAYDLILIDDKTKKTLGFFAAFLRYFMFIISAISIIGVLLPFFRKDKKTFQDLVMSTSVILVKSK